MITEEEIKNALRSVKYPGFSRDIVSFGLIKQASAREGAVSVSMQLTSGTPEVARQIKSESERVLQALPGVNLVHVEVTAPTGAQAAAAHNPWQNQNKVPGIHRIVAVASGKGGVGKSTTSVTLACALQHLGARVGLLDCDIYGPSIPLMMGIHRKPTLTEDETMMVPPVSHGVKLMSMGFLIEGDSPVIWRGPMIMKTIQQFVTSVAWGELDYLLVDPAARHRRRPTFPVSNGFAGRRRHRHHAPGSLARRGAQGHRHVPASQRPDSRHHREYELLHHAQWRAGGNLRPWRRTTGSGAPKDDIPRRDSNLY